MDKKHIQIVEHHLEVERKIIHLMLNHLPVISEMIEGGFSPDFFDADHRPIVDAIYREHSESGHKRLLTRTGYQNYLIEKGITKGNVYVAVQLHDKCFVGTDADADDLGSLKKQLTEAFIARKSQAYLADFADTCKSKGYLEAAADLSERLRAAVSLTETRRIFYGAGADIKDEYMENLAELKKHPELAIRCGMGAVDDPVNVGFRPQHLTLFVADVGGHKTNMMLNIGLRLAENGHGVLFIPLEMNRLDLMNRIVANRVGIDMTLLANPDKLDDKHFEMISQSDMWEKSQQYFHILDADERTSVLTLKHEIENKAAQFKPKVVIIDYVDNLEVDRSSKYGQRHIEIGEILKALRFLGKKYGFHVISAAQMNRAAIKAWREGKEEAIDSTAIHGSHQYSADSDTIFGILKVKDEPNRIKLHVIKARHGPQGQTYDLNVDPAHCLITSVSEVENMLGGTEFDTDDIVDTPEKAIEEKIEEAKESMGIDFAGALDDQPDLDDPEEWLN